VLTHLEPVATLVNNVRNKGAELAATAAAEDLVADPEQLAS